MYLGHDFTSQVNPFVLPYHRFRNKNGFYEAGNATSIVDVEQTVIQFDTLALKKTILCLGLLDGSWVGSPNATLFIKQNEAIVQEYNSEFIHDITLTDSYLTMIWAEIAPWSTCKITYINQTDTGNPRATKIFVTGQIG